LFVNISKEKKEEYTSFINRNELILVCESALGSLYTKKFENERIGLILTGGNYDLNKMPWQK